MYKSAIVRKRIKTALLIELRASTQLVENMGCEIHN